MKKKPWLFTLIVILGAGACALPWRGDIWLAVAYESKPVNWREFGCYQKRFSWLPGRDFILEDHVCSVCAEIPHDPMRKPERPAPDALLCMELTTSTFSIWNDTSVTFDPGSWRCLCQTCFPDRQ